jgi:pectin methylesterase-like acyl-CoA thioesterase
VIQFYTTRTNVKFFAVLLTAVFCFASSFLAAQQPAFPGAEGAGMYTSGGRGTTTTPTTVFEVTNLSDDGQPGSLRYALTATAAYRTVVFRVSGTIHLNSRLTIRANTTLAGQTAPGDGICVADYPVVISGDNVIVRYMRFRMGDKNQNKGKVDGSGGDDAFGSLGSNNLMIDHCSVSWSSDEALTIYRGDNLTIQWSFISEPLNYSYHFETGDTDYELHGYGGIWGAKRGSMHHNLIAHCRNRTPRFAGISTYTPNTIGVENVDFRNNVIYNWGINNVYGGDGGNYNVVNNYYKYGPNTSSGVRYRVCNPSFSATVPYGKWYVSGNYVDGSATITADNWAGGVVPQGGSGDIATVKATVPFDLGYPLATETALEAYENVLQKAGCALPNRDTLDQRIVNDVRNRTGRIIDVQGGYPHGTPYDQTVNAWPALNSVAAPADTDRDGMPDSYETANGLNPNDASDRSGVAANGYTNLENYLNSLAVPAVNTSPTIYASGSFNSFSQTTGTPSAAQTFSVSAVNLTNDITITAPADFQLSLDGTTWSTIVTLPQTNGSVASTSVRVRLNAGSNGNYTGNISLTSTGATTINIAVSGTTSAASTGAWTIYQANELPNSFTPAFVASQQSGAFTNTIVADAEKAGNNLLRMQTTVTTDGNQWRQNLTAGSQQLTLVFRAKGLDAAANLVFDADLDFGGSRWQTRILSSGNYSVATGTATSGSGSLGVNTLEWNIYRFVRNGNVGTLYVNENPTPVYTATAASGSASYFRFGDGWGSGIINSYIDWVAWDASGAYSPTDAPLPASLTGATSNPALTVTGTFGNFNQTIGAPSGNQIITLNGSNLTGNVTVTAPAGFEVSEDDNTWSSSLNIVPENGSVQTTISVRLNATAAGNYSGNITVASSGVTTVNITVSGSTQNATTVPAGTNAVVAKDGSGDFTSIQAAVNAAPTGRTTPYKIYIKKGKYVEPVIIPSNKPFIQLVGENLSETILSFDNYSGRPKAGGGTYGTNDCGTLIVNAPDVMVMNLSVENSTAYGKNANAIPPAPGDGPQAVAVYTTSDRVVFFNCRFNGGQDTYYGGNVKGTRVYLKNCYIDGNTDFMFGSSTIIFDTCIIYPRTRLDGGNGGYLTAVNTKPESGYGYVFRDTKITKNRGTTFYSLGRPWQNDGGTPDASKSHNKTVFLNTIMGSSINATGWSTWDAGTNTSYITYAEYNSKKYDGTPVDVSNRVPWSKQLTAAEAAKYYNNDTVFMNANTPQMAAWDPYATWADLGKAFTPEIAISNLIAKKTASTSTITWNLSWPMPGVNMDLYRSNDKTNFTLVNSQVSAEDSAGNFSFTENVPPAGQTYYYIVRASKAGLASITSDTTLVSSIPTITTTGAFVNFLQGIGTPSVTQTYTVSGVNLLDNITITPPAGYEISSNGTTWYNSSTPLVLTQTGGTVANTTITVRLNGTTTGTYNGNIVHTSNLATSVNLPVVGAIQTEPVVIPIVLQQWPLQQDAQDDAGLRAAGVVASSPTFNNLVLSNGTTVATYPAYSSANGQAFAATADGAWVPSPGGTPNRSYYQQFTVTAAQGYTLRVDSLLLSTAFYNTANGRLAVSYSLSNFVSDSTTTIPAATPSSPLVINNQNVGFTNVALALSATGVTVNAGQTLTLRLYYAAGTSSPGRYALLNNVRFKGLSTPLPPSPAITTAGTLNNFTQSLGTPGATQTYTVSGSNLTGNVTITPPAGYEISSNGGTTWFTTSTPLVLTPITGSVNATITVRLNAGATGSYFGNIVHASSGATSVNVAVTGATTPPPAVTVTGTLNAFAQTVGAPSAVQTYTIAATNLTGNLTITPPANYQVSSNGGTTWFSNASPLVLTPASGTIASTTISVRLNASAAGSYSGNITNATTGATTVNVAVTGTTVAAPSITVTGSLAAFSQTIGAPSAVKTYTVGGANLTDNIVVTAPAGYEISKDGTTWSASPITLTQTSGTVATTTVSVRLNANAAGSYSGSITHTSAGATTVNVAVSGTAVPPPSITINQSLTQFVQVMGSPSTVQTYTVSGANLTGNVTITPSLRYELSLNGSNWQTTPLTLTPTSGTLATTTISVRLNGIITGTFNGNLAHASTGLTTVNVPLNGFITIKQQYVLYPVPEHRTVFLSHPQLTEPAIITIYTVGGQRMKVLSTSPNSFETPIDVSNFRQGIYFVEMNIAGEKKILRLLKQ